MTLKSGANSVAGVLRAMRAFPSEFVTGAADVAIDLANTRPGHRAALRARTGDGRPKTLGVLLGDYSGS